jgi:3-carboxy-cis,cis-muconate cycloisomerase
MAELASALDAVGAACAKIGLDVVLLAQNEIGELSERDSGGSSSMPHKRNPAAAVLARACARLAHANASVLAGGEHELQRAAGAWQAEWPALSAALAFAGGASAAVRRSLEGLQVHADRMAANAAELDGDIGAADALVGRALAYYRAQP